MNEIVDDLFIAEDEDDRSSSSSYYSPLFRRVVRAPTNGLYEILSNTENSLETIVQDACKRIITHPDDIQWKKRQNDGTIRTPLVCAFEMVSIRDRDLPDQFCSTVFRAIVSADPSVVFRSFVSCCHFTVFPFHQGIVQLSDSDWMFLLSKMKYVTIQDIVTAIQIHIHLPADIARIIRDFMYGSAESFFDINSINYLIKVRSRNIHRIVDIIAHNPNILKTSTTEGVTAIHCLFIALNSSFEFEMPVCYLTSLEKEVKQAIMVCPDFILKADCIHDKYPFHRFVETFCREHYFHNKYHHQVFLRLIDFIGKYRKDAFFVHDVYDTTALHYFADTFTKYDLLSIPLLYEFMEFFRTVITSSKFPRTSLACRNTYGETVPQSIINRLPQEWAKEMFRNHFQFKSEEL